MSYALRADPVLTRDGQDLLDSDDLHLLLLLRDGGTEKAAEILGVTGATVLPEGASDRTEVAGERSWRTERSTRMGMELVDRMELYVRLLEGPAGEPLAATPA